ncbi:MAG: HDIG domain-containing protein [Bdellovibrionota bacterium]
MALILLMMRQSLDQATLPPLTAGERISFTLRVPRSASVVNEAATEKAKSGLLKDVREVYVFDDSYIQNWQADWQNLFRKINANPTQAVVLFEDFFKVQLSARDRDALLRIAKDRSVPDSISNSLRVIRGMRILPSGIKDGANLEILNFKARKAELVKVGKNYADIVKADEAKSAFLASRAYRDGPFLKWDLRMRKAVLSLQSYLIKPNVRLDEKQTKERVDRALGNFSPIVDYYQRGEVLLRQGERVTPEVVVLVDRLAKAYKNDKPIRPLFFEMLFGSLCLFLVLIYINHRYPLIFKNLKDTAVTGLLLCSSLASFKLGMWFSFESLSQSFPRVPLTVFLFALPLAAPSMLARLLLTEALSLLFAGLLSVGCAILMGKIGALFGLYVLGISLASIVLLDQCRSRSELYLSGLKMALVCAVGAAALILAWGGGLPLNSPEFQDLEGGVATGTAQILYGALGAALGGFLSAVLALAITPLFELVFGYTTDLKLLELARMDHPLLRELVIRAPGTFHHSLMVSSLAEAGAKEVGARSLLVRVGALFHDIGKMEKPEFFMENNLDGSKSHANLRPEESARIIVGHVVNGVHLAKQYGLRQEIIDFIEQHHGRALVGSFYYDAVKKAEAEGLTADSVNQELFRYPGPNPQSKEAAILSLADACEAASRGLPSPTPERLAQLVERIRGEFIKNGLFDDAPMTFQEMNIVLETFKRILVAVHHQRVQYSRDKEKPLEVLRNPDVPPYKKASGQ